MQYIPIAQATRAAAWIVGEGRMDWNGHSRMATNVDYRRCEVYPSAGKITTLED